MCESLFFNFQPLNVSKKMLKSNMKMNICWSQIENTFKVRDIGKVPYFDATQITFYLSVHFHVTQLYYPPSKKDRL